MEEFYLYQKQIFDSFSQRTIKNLSSTIHSKLDKQAEQENDTQIGQMLNLSAGTVNCMWTRM